MKTYLTGGLDAHDEVGEHEGDRSQEVGRVSHRPTFNTSLDLVQVGGVEGHSVVTQAPTKHLKYSIWGIMQFVRLTFPLVPRSVRMLSAILF